MLRTFLLITVAAGGLVSQAAAQRIEVLFLGDSRGHVPAERFPQMLQALGARGINLTYTDNPDDMNPGTLKKYDALLVFANIDTISPPQEAALLEYVNQGGAFLPLHCGSFCFRNSQRVVSMIGGQFKSHGTGEFSGTVVKPDHEIMKGFKPFMTWDETYVHSQLNPTNEVLMLRDQEPYTWVRQEGKGRVFYTAFGHDARTWGNAGFQDLMYRGLMWAIGDERKAAFEKWKLPELKYEEREGIPNYERRNPAPKFQLPLSPEESMKHIQVPVDCELKLVAAEPLVGNVIEMKWDERGRLWVIETWDYPNELKAPGSGRDRISILTDEDGDGTMDKSRVFADKLSIPTSLCFANGGVIVHAAPDTWFLKDTTGDDVADERKVLFSGWGTGDTHAGPSSLHHGFDGWIWGTVGYSGFGGKVGDKDLQFGQGVYRFRPDGSELQFLGATSNNTWGLGLMEDGTFVGSTANNQSSWQLPIPSWCFDGIGGVEQETNPGIDENKKMWVLTDKLRQVDVMGGYTSAAGHEIYTARSFPEDTWNRMALVCEPTGHVVYRANIDREGTALKAVNGWNLLGSSDEWVAPVVATTGPDGAVWVSDWYSFLVQHNPTPSPENGGFRARNGKGNAFQSDLRDTERCRIYRIAHKGAKPVPAPKLSTEDTRGLVAALSHENLLWRQHAQRLLVERGSRDVVEDLAKLATDGKFPAAIHALWALRILADNPNSHPDTLNTLTMVAPHALKSEDARVRKAALEAGGQYIGASQAAGIAGSDADASVRMAALQNLCLTRGDTFAMQPAVAELAGRALHDLEKDAVITKDRWLPLARTLAAAHHAPGYLKAAMAARPGKAEEAAAEKPQEGPNLFENASFEDVTDRKPKGWQVRTYGGEAEHRVGDIGHTGGKSLMIESARGSDTSWHQDVRVEPGSDYLLSGWIRTEGFKKGSGRGAMVQIHMLNGKQPHSPPVTTDGDWQRVELRFSTGRQREISVNLLYGGWGFSTGKAWWDDVSLTRVGTSSGSGSSPQDTLGTVARHFVKTAKPDDLKNMLTAAEAKSGAVAKVLKEAMAAAGRTAPKEETEEELAKTHTIIRIKSTVGTLMYDEKQVSAPLGKPIAIIYENPDLLQHNLIICAPGSYDKVGAEVEKLMTDPQGLNKAYTPDMPEVLTRCKLLDPKGRIIIKFTPDKAGDYPYLCTFPGHWRLMKGVLKVW